MKRSALVLAILFSAVALLENKYVVSTRINYKTKRRIVGQKTSAVFPPYDDPCDYFNPLKPSFRAPGRKISEEKCEEWKWDKLYQEELLRRSQECYEQRRDPSQPLPPGAVGGRITYPGEFPHMGAIGWKAADGGYSFRCGSTLISSRFVLTAAHCSSVSIKDTSVADPEPKIVRLNDKNLFHRVKGGISYRLDLNISRIIVHPEFKSPKRYFDIALFELETEVMFTLMVQPACLWTKRDLSEIGNDVTLTGWGALQKGSNAISPELQAAVMNIINSTYCDQLLQSSQNRNWKGLQDHQLCAGKLAGGVDACQMDGIVSPCKVCDNENGLYKLGNQYNTIKELFSRNQSTMYESKFWILKWFHPKKGDSGSPLQIKKHIAGSVKESVHYIVGVTSFGIGNGCAHPNLPGVYTRVSSFVSWIESHVWPHRNPKKNDDDGHPIKSTVAKPILIIESKPRSRKWMMTEIEDTKVLLTEKVKVPSFLDWIERDIWPHRNPKKFDVDSRPIKIDNSEVKPNLIHESKSRSRKWTLPEKDDAKSLVTVKEIPRSYPFEIDLRLVLYT